MKNNPKDEDFIKRAHENPSWPNDIDKPCDWSKVSSWRKTWFRIGGAVKAIFWVLVFSGLFIALIELIDAGEGMDEPYCNQSPQGCFE